MAKMKTPNIPLKDVQAAARELTKKMFDPGIKTTTDCRGMIEEIWSNCMGEPGEPGIYDEDEKSLSKETWAVLRKIGVLDNLGIFDGTTTKIREEKGTMEKKDVADKTAKIREAAPAEKKAAAPAKEPAKKAAPAKKDAGKAPKNKEPNGKSAFGHRGGSMSAAIDGMVEKGVKLDKAIQTLVANFDKDEASAERKFKSHVRHLGNMHGVTVNVDKDTYKLT